MLKSILRENARKYGYEIRKAPTSQFRPLPVFDLALQYLLLTRGNQLTFIEIGANDGVSDDPLRELVVKYPWRGVLVEPQPDVFQTLKSNYTGFEDRVALENVAISTNPAPLEMYRVSKNSKSEHAGSTIASANSKTTAKQAQVSQGDLEKISVPTTTLDSLVQKHCLNQLDILQLDTEGYEWDVLQTLDLNKTRPWIIGFEHGHQTPASIDSMVQHLNRHGYFVNYGGYNTDSVAVRNDFIAG